MLRRGKQWWVVVTLLAPCMALAARNDSGLYLTPVEAMPGTSLSITKQEPGSPVTMSADEMGMDEDHGIVIARGHVEVMQGDSILTADQITYYQKTNLVVAEGNVSMLQPTGDVYFAEKAELKDTMKQGVIHNFKARLADNSILVANRAVKVNSSVTELKKASYTPCNLCEGVAPFWQMDAGSARIDNAEERVTYRDAYMEMFGIPFLYTPYLSHPTPDASGKSGLGTPSYSTNPYFGSIVKVPYYWRINESQDVMLTPWVTTSEGPLLQWDYRQLTNAGNYHVQGSATFPKKIDDSGNKISGNEFRGHIFAQGDETVGDHSHIGFDIQRASDDTYLRRYGFDSQQALFSRAYYEHAVGRNFALAEGLSIQGLRSTDNQRTTPLVLPILQGYYETPAYESGIKLHVSGDAQMLSRSLGVDQQRISITPGATLPIITDGGQIFTTTVNLRQDIYNANDVTLTNGNSYDGTTTRTLPLAALEWRFPLINTLEIGTLLVEPVVLGVLQANGGNPDTISNEDSRLIELSDTNLFSLNRMPGLDLVDSGSRVAYGLRSHYYDTSGIGLDGMLGQNYNFNSDTPYPNSTRAGEQFSDFIGRIAANYMPVSLSYRFALDKEEASLNRSEFGLSFSEPWLAFSGTYRALKNNQYIDDSREAILSASLPLSDEWSIYGNGRRDLELDQMVTANGGIIYKNECFNVMFDTLRVYTRDRDIEPTTEFTFRVGFKNLGEFGGK
ncbi:MAG: LPS-assembly protein LptD [Rickettsiales bacterium]